MDKLNIPENIDLNEVNHPPTEFNGWPDPEPVEIPLPEVKTLTPEMLPAPLRGWLADISTRMSCPADGVAVTALIMASPVNGTRCSAHPLRFDGWDVNPDHGG